VLAADRLRAEALGFRSDTTKHSECARGERKLLTSGLLFAAADDHRDGRGDLGVIDAALRQEPCGSQPGQPRKSEQEVFCADVAVAESPAFRVGTGDDLA
jgi:hypothetical protein